MGKKLEESRWKDEGIHQEFLFDAISNADERIATQG